MASKMNEYYLLIIKFILKPFGAVVPLLEHIFMAI